MIQLAVTYLDNNHAWFPVSPEQGWRLDAATRCLIVGRGVPRIHIPLDSIRYFEIEETPDPLSRAR